MKNVSVIEEEKMFNKRELELLQRMCVRDEHCDKAVFTKENERTEYQVELLALWDKIHNLNKSN